VPAFAATTEFDLGEPPLPGPAPSTNSLFTEALQGIPAAGPNTRPSEFDTVLRPFSAEAFATGIGQSHAGIGPMAMVVLEDGTVLAGGGLNRGSLYRFGPTGDAAGTPIATLPHPVFDMALDANGTIWATTGGGPLLQIDPDTGAILNAFGEGLTQSLAIAPDTGLIHVSSGAGIEIFDPLTQTFGHFSDLRVGSLRIAPDGTLWAATWPDRGDVVRFDDQGDPQPMLRFDAPIDSLAFGADDSSLQDLLFVSSNTGVLTMVDLVTLQRVAVATGGSRGDIVLTLPDGRVLLSQTNQIDLLNPVLAPVVVRVSPPDEAIVALPLGSLAVTFDQDMMVPHSGIATDSPSFLASVVNIDNFVLMSHNNGPIAITSVLYDEETRTAFVNFDAIGADVYELQVSGVLQSTTGVPLGETFTSTFTAVSDFTRFVDLEFFNARSSRAFGTVSYDVRITNTGTPTLVLPVVLVLDPAAGFDGVPINALPKTEGSGFFIDLSATLPTGGRLQPGEATTGRTVTIDNPVGQHVDFTASVSALTEPNVVPLFTSDPVTEATVGELYTYQATADDPDGAALLFLALSAPNGMTVDPVTGLVGWTPSPADPARAAVVLQVYDARGGRATQEYLIDVAGANRAPLFSDVPATFTGQEGESLSLLISASDPDGDRTVVWADNLPPGAAYEPASRLLHWMPGSGDAGTYEGIRFTATDGIETVDTELTLLIQPQNQMPVLTRPADRTIAEGDRLVIRLGAVDPEGKPLRFFSPLLPPGATLDPDTGEFDWTPTFFQAGVYEVAFSASDGETVVTEETTLTVLNVNAPPRFIGLGAFEVQEGQLLSIRTVAFDPDNPIFVPRDRLDDGAAFPLDTTDPTVAYTVEGLPGGAAFDSETVLFEWTPDFDRAGQFTFTVIATDDGNGTGTALSAISQVPITVLNTNRPPELDPVDNVSLSRGDSKDIPINTSDPDGNPISLSVEDERPGFDLPSFITFTDQGDGTGVLQLSPGFGDRGDYTVTVRAADDGDVTGGGNSGTVESDELSFIITIDSPNEQPILEPIGDKVAVVGETVSFTVRVSDLDEDELNFEAFGLPLGATLTEGAAYGTAVVDWAPLAGDLGTHTVTFRVTDSGNGDLNEVLSDERTVDLVVRNANVAPVLLPIGNRAVNEGEELTIDLSAIDPDGDSLLFGAEPLPDGARFDPIAGVLEWTPTLFQAGEFEVTFRVDDGNRSGAETMTITVNNVNQAPAIVPQLPQRGRENTSLSFTLAAGDADGDPIVFTVVSGLPRGAVFDAASGLLEWTPNFDQSGLFFVRFAAEDGEGGRDELDVPIMINNVNRAPILLAESHTAVIGETLSFAVAAEDPDPNTTLAFSADGLPDGAVIDSATGVVEWTPGPGQAAEFTVRYSVTDGETTVTDAAVIRAGLSALRPAVTILLTPSFPAAPSQPVAIRVLASSLAPIVARTLAVDGKPVTLDAAGRGTFTPTGAGVFTIEATATDADGLVGQGTKALKVRLPGDQEGPVVSFDRSLINARLSDVTDVVATVLDANLERWELELALFGFGDFVELARGTTAFTGERIARIDPSRLANGFYRLRLTGTDISGRGAAAEVLLEVNTSTKSARYQRTAVDLSADLGGVSIELTRVYDSLSAARSGVFGLGWRSPAEVRVQTNVPRTGLETRGRYNPLSVGSRLYLTLPDAAVTHRVGFTFAPVAQVQEGVTFHTPAWVADDGGYILESPHAVLTLAGGKLYDLKTAEPYNPESGAFGDIEYTLTAPDGSAYLITTDDGVREQRLPTGERIIYAGGGITNLANGQSVLFVRDGEGRITRAMARAGVMVYDYDAAGHLVAARDLSTGQTTRYGYEPGAPGLLTLATGFNGQAGESINYLADPVVSPITANLGTARQFIGTPFAASLNAGATDRYTFLLRDSELASTNAGAVLMGVTVEASADSTLTPGAPTIAGVSPLASQTQGQRSFALFAIETSALQLLSVSGADAFTAGAYQVTFSIGGDINADGLVDGIDSQAFEAARGSAAGETTYAESADADRNGVVEGSDAHVLASNFGFVANRPPAGQTATFATHEGLEVRIPLDGLVSDPEDDPLFYRVVAATNGTAALSVDGSAVRFTPDAGFTGTASFLFEANDGFASSQEIGVDVQVSDAKLTRIRAVAAGDGPHLVLVGQSRRLAFLGDFEDAADVPLPPSYLALESLDPEVAAVAPTGDVIGLAGGSAVIKASRDGLSSFTVLFVGRPETTQDQTVFVFGLDVYPNAITLPAENGRRQLTVTGLDGRLDLTAGSTGTTYFTSDSNVVEVSADGEVLARNAGRATITIANGAGGIDVPVLISEPQADSAMIDDEGGILVTDDGSLILFAPGAFEATTPVSFTRMAEAELPFTLPAGWDFAAAFDIDFGDAHLNERAQLVFPVTGDFRPGDQIIFARPMQLPDGEGGLVNAYLQLEEGVVQNDGMVVTTSLPWDGINDASEVVAMSPERQTDLQRRIHRIGLQNARAGFSPVAPGDANALADFGLEEGVFILSAGFVSGPGAAVLAANLTLLRLMYLAVPVPDHPTPLPLRLLSIAPEGGFSATPFNVQIDPDAVSNFELILPIEQPPTDSPSGPPVIESVAIDSESLTTSARVKVTGFRFTFDNGAPADQQAGHVLGSRIEDLRLIYDLGIEDNDDERFEVEPEESNPIGEGKFEIFFPIPRHIAVGRATLVVNRPQNDPVVELGRPEIQYERREHLSEGVRLAPQGQFAAAALAHSDQLAIMDATTHELIARAPVGLESEVSRPRAVGLTTDRTRAYVTLRGEGAVAVFDMMALQPIDIDPDTDQIDSIPMPPGGTPFWIAVDPNDQFAYVSDERLGAIYVIDISPVSDTYHQVVQTIQVGPAPLGLRGLDVSVDNKRLYVAAPERTLFVTPPGAAGAGRILVVNVDPLDRPATADALNLRNWREQVAEIVAGQEPYGVTVSGDPNRITYTNRMSDFKGLGLITVTNNDPLSFATTSGFVPLLLGSNSDTFDVNNGQAVVVTADLKYAFVTGFNRFVQFVPSHDPFIDPIRAGGSNVGIIRDPFDLFPDMTGPKGLVAATRPIPIGLADNLALTPDGKALYVAYRHTDSVFVFDVEQMLTTVEQAIADADQLDQLDKIHLDDLNSSISIRANYREIGPRIFGVPPDATDGSIGTGGSPLGLDTSGIGLKLIEPIGVVPPPGPEFTWELDGDGWTSKFYLSAYQLGDGLLPSDTPPDIEPKLLIDGDINFTRIVNGVGVGSETTYTLPTEKELTAGNIYYWGIEARRGNQIERAAAAFPVMLEPPASGYPSVTIINHGFELDFSGIVPSFSTQQQGPLTSGQRKFLELAKEISDATGGGIILLYNPAGNPKPAMDSNDKPLWTPLRTGESPTDGKALILVGNWVKESDIDDSGFAEAAADAMFAALTRLNSENDGKVLQAPLHFIGHGRGAVVNSEMIQRIGAYFPAVTNIHMTTLDPHDFKQENLKFQATEALSNLTTLLGQQLLGGDNQVSKKATEQAKKLVDKVIGKIREKAGSIAEKSAVADFIFKQLFGEGDNKGLVGALTSSDSTLSKLFGDADEVNWNDFKDPEVQI